MVRALVLGLALFGCASSNKASAPPVAPQEPLAVTAPAPVNPPLPAAETPCETANCPAPAPCNGPNCGTAKAAPTKLVCDKDSKDERCSGNPILELR